MLEQHIVLLRDENLPVLGGRIVFRRGHDGEIAAILIGADVEEIFAVIDVVAVFLLARQEDSKIALRLVRAQPAKLGGVFGGAPEKDIFLVARLLHGNIVEFVLLFVDGFKRGRPEHVPPQLIGPLGDGVLGGQEERLVVGRPHHGIHALGSVRQRLARAQILHLQSILTEAREVHGIGEQVVVVADYKVAQPHELVRLREFVQIQQDFFRRFHAAFAAALNRILFALFGARVVEVAPAARRYGEVRLFDAAQHLFVQRVLEGRQIRGHGLGIGILRFQIFDNLGIGFFAQPVVVVDNRGAVALFAMVFGGGYGRGRLGRNCSQADQEKQGQHDLMTHAPDYIVGRDSRPACPLNSRLLASPRWSCGSHRRTR